MIFYDGYIPSIYLVFLAKWLFYLCEEEIFQA